MIAKLSKKQYPEIHNTNQCYQLVDSLKVKKMSEKTPIRYESNPFLSEMTFNLANKNIKITAGNGLGIDENIVINQKTGEVAGTHVVAHKKVDSTKFVKAFADYFSFTFDLTKAGNKALRVVMYALSNTSISKDVVILDNHTRESFLKKHQGIEPPLTLSEPTFRRGLSELEKAKVIAKTMRKGSYYINPSVMFNGDRIAFSTIIEKGEQQTEMELEADII